MEINKLALKALYENNKDEYYRRRNSNDADQWDEAYKWKIFPELNKALAQFETISRDNAKDIFKILLKANPQQGSFTYWGDNDDFKKLLEHPNGFQSLRDIWHTSPEQAAAAISNANIVAQQLYHKNFGPALYGYMLAAQDCSKFAPYHSSMLTIAAELNNVGTGNTLSQGEKYQLFNNTALYVGTLMQAEHPEDSAYQYIAMNGQDFLYILAQYPSNGT